MPEAGLSLIFLSSLIVFEYIYDVSVLRFLACLYFWLSRNAAALLMNPFMNLWLPLLMFVEYLTSVCMKLPFPFCLWQWVPRESSGVITDATYSCDCQSVYATFEDGSVSIITTPSFQHRCRIYPAAYLPCSPRYFIWWTLKCAYKLFTWPSSNCYSIIRQHKGIPNCSCGSSIWT